MFTFIRISASIIIIMIIESSFLIAQNQGIDFSKLITGKDYKVLLKNGWDTEGTLIGKDTTSIRLTNDISMYTIKKTDIAQIIDSDSEFREEGLVLQADSILKTIVLTDGSELIGYITGEDSMSIKFRTQSGTILSINRSQIKSTESERSDYRIGSDPNESRLLFAPTGKTLKGGTGYFSVSELLFPMIAMGLTDYITVAGGISIVPGAEAQLFYLNGKVRVLKVKNFDLSTGLLYTNVTSSSESGLTELYAIGTYGTDNISLTLGGGLSFTSNSSETYPILIIGGEARVSNSVKFVSENWIPTEPKSGKIFSIGVRFFGKRLAGDFGLILPVDNRGETIRGWPFIPWIGLNYNFDL